MVFAKLSSTKAGGRVMSNAVPSKQESLVDLLAKLEDIITGENVVPSVMGQMESICVIVVWF